MSMIKIGMIGIAAVFLALLLKKEKGELALLVGIAASVLIFGYTLSRISFILDFLRELSHNLFLTKYRRHASFQTIFSLHRLQ